jgi:hypothetical protein
LELLLITLVTCLNEIAKVLICVGVKSAEKVIKMIGMKRLTEIGAVELVEVNI